MADAPEHHASAVINGEVQHFSVTALEKADPRDGGCLRSWWYRYVGKIKFPPTANMAAGTALHAELERYLLTGDTHLSALALSGMHIVPEPGPDLLVEHSIAGGLLTAGGVGLIGKIDLHHRRGTNKGGEDPSDLYDPPGTVEVIDWKWKGDGSKHEYFKQPGELVRTIQMAGYGVWASRAYPDATHVRLSHGYFPAKRGRPRKVTRLHVIDDVLRTWEYVDGLGRTVRQVAKETDPERVDGNPNACGKYGGCPHRSYCTAGQTTSLSLIFGESQAKEMKMSLMPTTAPVDLKATLAAEESAMRVQSTAVSGGTVSPEFAAAWAAIERNQAVHGVPAVGAGAAAMVATIKGLQLQGHGYAGSGRFGAYTILDPQHVIQMGNELIAEEKRMAANVAPPPPVPTPIPTSFLAPAPVAPPVPAPAPVVHVSHNAAPLSVLPPDAPESKPELAAKPVEGFGPAVILSQAAGVPTYTTPEAAAIMRMDSPPVVNPVAELPAAPKAKRGRPAKVATETHTGATGNVTAVLSAPDTVTVTTSVDTAGGPIVIDTRDVRCSPGLAVFVDCTPNDAHESLAPYIDALLAELVKRFCPPGTVQDVCAAPKDSPIGFGGWKGAIRAMTLECPPPDGRYVVDTRGGEATQIVADAMRTVCERRGALYVRARG